MPEQRGSFGKGDGQVQLRLLATTDLHAHLLAWDYYAHRPAPNRGLARIASLIAKARAECSASILLDNGDFLSGSGLGDYVAQRPPSDAPHPMIAAMNALRYDAVNLGNHEFSHGLPFLAKALSDAQFPVLCTNFAFSDLPKVQRHIILPCKVIDSIGKTQHLNIGVMGLLPAQTLMWEAANLHDRAQAQPMAPAAQAMAQDLRQQGADVVIALAHTGLAGQGVDLGEERHADIIAALPDIDAVIAGHTHQTFPDEGADVAARPLLQPGFFGSHLGVMDLSLHHDGARWRVGHHSTRLWPIAQRDKASGQLSAATADCPQVLSVAQPVHAAVIDQAQQVIGQLPHRLHSFLATIASSAAMRVIAQAQADYLAQVLPHTADAGLPILAAVAPFKAGGRGGPENYTNLPQGPFRHHHAADLYMHPNSFVAFRLNGHDLALWLERSVSKFAQIPKNGQDIMLLNPDFPSFNFDMIFGLTYDIDLSQPPMFDAQGMLIHPNSRRIGNLRYMGEKLHDQQVFALASNSYRSQGNAGFFSADRAHIIYQSRDLVQDILRRYVSSAPAAPRADDGHWRFLPQHGSTAIFDTSPLAVEVMAEIAHFQPEMIGVTEAGFTRFRLHL